ncbi:hypothetical protein JMJ78_0012452 [Colletotrichum scovillei]|nr:hypothetical protein JMJ78_0012452 [Colletotrichum scovillei]
MGRGYDHFFFRARSSVWLAYKFDTDAEYRRGLTAMDKVRTSDAPACRVWIILHHAPEFYSGSDQANGQVWTRGLEVPQR